MNTKGRCQVFLNLGKSEEEMLLGIMDFLCTKKKSSAVIWAINQAHKIAISLQGKVKASNIGKVESNNTNTQE